MAEAGDTGEVDALRVDLHVHSGLSADAAGTIVENLAAARDRELTEVVCVEHVTAATPWVPVFKRSVRLAGRLTAGMLEVLCGVEAAVLDATGRLDLPARMPSLDRVL